MAKSLSEVKVFSPANIAKRWDCDPKTVTNRISRGELRGFRVGKLLRVREDDLEAFERGAKCAAAGI